MTSFFRGGGGFTFGIVTSAIVKAHPQVPVTTSTFSFATSDNVSADIFWAGVAAYWDQVPAYNGAKTYSYFSVVNASGSYIFTMAPFFATNKTKDEYEALAGPLFAALAALGIPHVATTEHFASFYPAYEATFATYDMKIGSYSALTGSRLLPAENWANETMRAKTLQALRDTVDRAAVVNGYHQAPADGATIHSNNSVNPAFRIEAGQLIVVKVVDGDATPQALQAAGEDMTYGIMGPLRDATPAGGAYGNEADVGEPDWQQAFWGDHYARLRAIKAKWDPAGLFYVHHGYVRLFTCQHASVFKS